MNFLIRWNVENNGLFLRLLFAIFFLRMGKLTRGSSRDSRELRGLRVNAEKVEQYPFHFLDFRTRKMGKREVERGGGGKISSF